MTELLFGRNAIREALIAKRRRFFRLVLADRFEPSTVIDEIHALARRNNLPVDRMDRKRMDKLAQNHQGVMLEVGPYPYAELAELIEHAESTGEDPFFLALDHIEDPHNLGAMIRTAELTGVHGIIIPNKGQAEVTPAVVKASVGACEHVRIARIANIPQAVSHLKKQGIWAIGLQHSPQSKSFHQADLKGPIVLVVGSEGDGMSRIVRETCDFLIEIPMRGKTESLNASVATALVLYETWRTRGFEGKR
jgi:23S rRNA (guanosine2251-2'-O)-methyltransferase